MNKPHINFIRDWKEPYPQEEINAAMKEYGDDAILFQLDNHDDSIWLVICGSEEEARTIQDGYTKEMNRLNGVYENPPS